MSLVIGKTYGRLLVLSQQSRICGGRTRVFVQCKCSCGSLVTVRADAVGVRANSCGCLNRELSASRLKIAATTHGLKGSSEHTAWVSMVQRCSNPSAVGYENYGGRGIQVCERWLKFENFYADMGPRPDGLSLDRIDNNKGYEPGNCRWATKVEQANNKRSNRLLTHLGKTQTVAEWSRELGLRSGTIRQRIDVYGWSVSSALSKGV